MDFLLCAGIVIPTIMRRIEAHVPKETVEGTATIAVVILRLRAGLSPEGIPVVTLPFPCNRATVGSAAMNQCAP